MHVDYCASVSVCVCVCVCVSPWMDVSNKRKRWTNSPDPLLSLPFLVVKGVLTTTTGHCTDDHDIYSAFSACTESQKHTHTHTHTKNHNVNLCHNALWKDWAPFKNTPATKDSSWHSTCCQGWGHGEPCHRKPRKQMRQVYYANSWLHGHS